MGLSIRSNLMASQALFHLGRNNRSLTESVGRISSGYRVNSAADDPAGASVAVNLETRNRSLQQAIRNANDGVSVIQTAESATDEVTDLLQRMRELAVEGASETLDDDERTYIEDEFDELVDEVERIAANTEFNGITLSDGTTTQMDTQVGIENASSSRITIDLGDLTSTTLGLTSAVTVQSVTGATAAIDTIDAALDSVNGYRSDLGASQTRLDSAINFAESYSTALTMAEGNIVDADIAKESANMAKLQILQEAGLAALAQANQINRSVLTLLEAA
jgi:flagellin